MKIVKEGFPYIIILVILAITSYFFSAPLGVFFAILAFFVAFFFRDPKRTIEHKKFDILSPADGKIMRITHVEEPIYIRGPAIKVSIFLSIFNVHINRFPVDGKIELVRHVPGKFKPANQKDIAEHNERNYIGIASEFGKILVVQIAGLIARRIVCWNNEGDSLKAGDKFGIIKFSSCTEIYLPLESEILVKEGESVIGGITIIGRVNNDKK